MISIAAYLASLAGGAPQEGQKATQAGATGASGLFAALLSSSQGETPPAASGTEGKDTLLGLLASSETQIDPAIAAQLTQLAENDPRLARLLAEGLPGADGDVTAAITPPGIQENPVTAIDGLLSAEGEAGVAPNVSEVEGEVPAPAVPLPAGVAANADVDAPSADAATTVPATAPASDGGAATQTPVVPVQTQGEQASENPAPRNKGLETALQHASDSGHGNGLQNAVASGLRAASEQTVQPQQNNQAAQVNQTAQTNQAAPFADGEAEVTSGKSASGEANPVRPQAAGAPGNEQTTRNETQPARSRVTVQRILDAGNGKSVIQIHERAGGEAASTASPPTLTVNVQASAASPGPASPNTPHVPVSALAVHIAQQHNKGAQRFDIMMDPPELGRIEVRLDVARDGQVTTHLVVERSETLDLLQRDARQLERALNGAGLNTSEDGMKFSLKDQGLAQGNHDGSPNGENEDGNPDMKTGEASEAHEDTPKPVRYMATTGLDIRI